MDQWIPRRIVGEFEDCMCWELTLDSISLFQWVRNGADIPTGMSVEDPLQLYFLLKGRFDHLYALMSLSWKRQRPVFFRDDFGIHQMNKNGYVVSHAMEGEDWIPPIFR